MKTLAITLFTVTFLGLTTTSFADKFGDKDGSFWADTPIGRLECREEDGQQVVKIDGKAEHRLDDSRVGGSIFPFGLVGSTSCPEFIANEYGYVVYEFHQELETGNNPAADILYVIGLMYYKVINFNVSPPKIIDLTLAQWREGNNYQSRFIWDKNGFTLRYYGYPFDKSWWEYLTRPKPKFHTIRFDFATQKISRIK